MRRVILVVLIGAIGWLHQLGCDVFRYDVGDFQQACFDDGSCREPYVCGGGTCRDKQVECAGRACGLSTSGKLQCGVCGGQETCNASGQCECTYDTCGAVCCSALQECVDGQCQCLYLSCDGLCCQESAVCYGGSCVPSGCGPVAFADANLESVVREELGNPQGELQFSEVQQIRYLHSWNKVISSLEGLQCLQALESLSIDGGSISDLGPLASLTKLREIWLSYQDINDISPLAGLTQLESLALNGNKINDISMIVDFSNLHTLQIGYNQQLTSIDAVYTLTDLHSLDVSALPVDLSRLSAIQNLRTLRLNNCEITDLAPLFALVDLQDLSVASTSISSLDFVAQFPSLVSLKVSQNPISDLTPLASQSQLTQFYAYGCNISDLSALSGLRNLEWIGIGNNPLNGLQALSQLSRLRSVDIANTGTTELTVLAGLLLLSQVYARDNQIQDLSPLVDNLGIGQDDYLVLNGNPIDCESQADNIQALRSRGANLEIDDCP